jgi:hypothetical protein
MVWIEAQGGRVMLGRRSDQGELFRPDHTLMEHVGRDSLYGFLGTEGRQIFRDEDFADLFRSGTGRPSVPPSQLCVLMLLQAREGVSDDEAIQRTAYDLRWKVSLGLNLEEKLCAKSTLQLFRGKLVLHEKYGEILDASVEACRKAGLLRNRRLEVAVDTTPVLGRGAVKDTFNLLSEQIRVVIEESCSLKGWNRESVVAEQGLGRHFGKSFKGEVELDWSDPGEKRALVGQVVADARVVLTVSGKALSGFRKGSARAQKLREARGLLGDLLLQDVDEKPEDGGGPEIRKGTSRDRIVSRTDPEMRHGHKSHSKRFDGYKASAVVETGDGVILSTEVHAANAPDSEGAAEQIEDASARAGKPVERVLGDAAYGGIETRKKLAKPGREVIVKTAPAGKRKGCFSWEDFRISRSHQSALCPAGHRSIRRERVTMRPSGVEAWRYVFSRNDCTGCLLRSQCTTAKVTARMITVSDQAGELLRLRKTQRSPGFRKKYRRRVVVERELGHLTARGIRQARYCGRSKTALQVAIAAAVVNLGKALASWGASRPWNRAVTVFLRLCRVLSGQKLHNAASPSRWLAAARPHRSTWQMAACRPAF